MPPKYLRSLALALALLLGLSAEAQDNYIHVLGLRAGNPLGVSYKRFTGRYSAWEGILGLHFNHDNAITLTGLYEYHFVFGERLNAYLGAGLTLGSNGSNGVANADVAAGLDYVFEFYPLNVSLDYKPYYNLVERQEFGLQGFAVYNEWALSIRYILE